ncbi:multicopper oxidase family protein [Clostridium sp. DJ247]|uniref:multicopper oxidase family protein n=1 Tax=Clostridium sp. DJ247 TaxID=2726188 RepID=UPI001626DE1B|nr:multicopper oxidase domain-containing protein [Clostridium sp. DJ247]MBC2582038.1 multicopper oxidase domain-containing protein [Clostridium sp. DJ247]
MNKKRSILIAVLIAATTALGYYLASSVIKNNHNENKLSETKTIMKSHMEEQDPMNSSGGNKGSIKQSTALPIPKLLEDKNPESNLADFTLSAQEGTTSFFNGKQTNTYGYNGNYLGPVIRVNRGEEVNIHVNNKLNESTTVHWHGLNVNGDIDGGPHQPIESGSQWNIKFNVNQPAATLWFHPHTNEKTSIQVYKGLAGLIYVDDEVSNKLNIPKEYGVNDIPLVIQDKTFDDNGNIFYSQRKSMDGALGDTILVNGAVQPYLDVKKTKMRFRIVNGSNARNYNLQLSNGEDFMQIASDGGFLGAPVKLNKLELGPGERAEIIVDFSKYKDGSTVALSGGKFNIMAFNVKGEDIDNTMIPEKLTEIEKLSQESVSTTRKFDLQGMGNMVTINGKKMDMNRIDEKVKLNDTEIWEINNIGDMMDGMSHPFHIHGVQFQILSRDGKQPSENERGWKDTILIHPGEKVRIIMKFTEKGLFMYHCHILEHEDGGMMGQMKVQ